MIDDVAIRAVVERIAGVSVGDLVRRPLSGGSINETFLVDAGPRIVFKTNGHQLAGHFEAEARGLAALREAATELVVPEVYDFSDDPRGSSYIAIEYIEPAPRVADFDERLGRGLAQLHEVSSDQGFGFDVEGYCGATPQPNSWAASWREFYAERRLGHLSARAQERGIDTDTVRILDGLIERLGDWIGDDEPPALIHGDLWSGNLHVSSSGTPALIDPAAYFGHREAELGMMTLFGGFAPRVWEAYQDFRPLSPGWRQRSGLYELYHVLNHFVLFGGSYAQQARELALRYAG